MAALIEGALARVLEKHRESLNARFAAATTRRSIDRHSFSSHVREVIAPIVESVEGVDDAAPERVTLALYDLSLQLFASDLLGSTARTGAVAYAWRRLLPLLPHLIRIDARRVVGVVTNAVVNVGAHIDPTLWTDDMIRVSDASLDFEGLLDTGRIAAWRRGVTHYRSAALETLGRLPETLSAQLLAIPVAAVPSAIVQLRANRWVDPALAMNAEPTLRLLGSYGSFRGFGGGFVKRPHVFEWENRLIVTSGDRQWELPADRSPLPGRD